MNLSETKFKNCRICPVECGADRREKPGFCGAGSDLKIASWNLHFGEEPVISGKRGSGAIFFAHCTLKCIFCQNYPISHLGNGRVFTMDEFIDIMLKLQSEGAHNINLITATHYQPYIREALEYLKPGKLNIPVVYNCGGYEKAESLRELEGLIDIYMPDAKFSSPRLSSTLTAVSDYPEINKAALREMYRQRGNVKTGTDGLMREGLLVRHLVLPGYIKNSKKVLQFLSKEFGSGIYLSIMSQYHPACRSGEISSLRRRLTGSEYNSIIKLAKKMNFKEVYYQDL